MNLNLTEKGAAGTTLESTEGLSLSSGWSLPISSIAGHRRSLATAQYQVHPGQIIKALQSNPKSLRPGFAVAFASQESAQPRRHPHGFAQSGRLGRQFRPLGDICY